MKQVESAKAKGSRQKRRNVVIFFDAGKVLRRPEWLVPRCFALHFTWSETMRVKFHELASDLSEGNPPPSEVDWHNPTIQEIFTYMSFWYGSL
jgi:hypothetical protein